MDYVKISDTEFKSVETKQEETTHNLNDLKSERSTLVNQIGACQVRVDQIDALLKTANGLGMSV